MDTPFVLTMTQNPPSPENEIRRLIRQHGKITFAEFMGIALYHPKGGYYTAPSAFGASGDYYTSATAHPAFGALLAIQAQRMWERLDKPRHFFTIELGAGSGQMARDFLGYAYLLDSRFYDSLAYVTVDRYALTIPRADARRIQQVISDGTPFRGIVGCVIANELVDAFPFHRFRMNEGRVKEVFVSLDDGDEFVELLDEPSTPEITQRLGELGLDLPDGYAGEVNLKAGTWLREVTNAIEKGFVITIDYGHEARDLYSLDRPQGTFETYYRHTRGASPYQRIGRQDITAHVDYSLLMSEGEKYGLNTVALLTQAEYLERLGFGKMRDMLRARGLPQRELRANMMGMLELVKPDGFGEFKVLIQEKGTAVEEFDEMTRVVDTPDVPLLKEGHTPLFEGRYPQQSWEMESLWPFGESDSEKY